MSIVPPARSTRQGAVASTAVTRVVPRGPRPRPASLVAPERPPPGALRDLVHAPRAVHRPPVAVVVEGGSPDEGVDERRLEEERLDAGERREPEEPAHAAREV